jgi:hypothetical protein
MVDRKHLYITLDWQEQGPMETTGRRLWRKERIVCTPEDYPQKLSCHNPTCENGGFDIGERISTLIASRGTTEQNSLICSNAIHDDRSKRCLHTIIYSLTAVLPYKRDVPSVVSNRTKASQRQSNTEHEKR